MIAEFLPQRLVEALGWTLLHSLWQVALFAFVGALLLIFMRKFSAIARYRMIGIIMCLFLCTSIFTFVKFYSWKAPNEQLTENVLSAQPGAAEAETVETFNGEASIESHLPVAEQAQLTAAPPPSFLDRTADYFDDHLPLIVSLWMLAIFGLLLRLLGQLAYIQRIKSYGVEQFPDRWDEILRELEDRLEIRKKVNYLSSRLVDSPMALGWWKPYILFPIELLSGLSETEVRSILAHELAHVRRNDYAVNLLQSLLGILYFYHPGSWWLSQRLSEEREHCCDDLALELGADPRQYAKTIIHLKELQMKTIPLSQNMTGKNGESAFSVRILRLLRSPLQAANYREGFMTAILLVLGLVTAVQAASFSSTNSPELPFGSERLSTVIAPEVGTEEEGFSNRAIVSEDESGGSHSDVFEGGDFNFDFNEPNVPNEVNEANEPNAEKDELDLLLDAISEGQMDLVLYFLDQGVAINKENADGWTPLMVAASENELAIAELLLARGATTDYINNNGWTALIEAADEGAYEVAKLLLDHGADPNLKGRRLEYNAAVMAASEGHLNVLELLIDAGADIETDKGPYPMLHVAAEEGQLDVVQFLLEKGAEINGLDKRGRTALSYAAEEGQNHLVSFLLEKGADPDIKDNEGWSAHIYAADEGNVRGLELLSATANGRKDPLVLYAAIREGNTDIVANLLRDNYNPNERFEGGRTPLMLAVKEEESDLVRLLISRGAEVNARDFEGRTALFFAAREDNPATINMLADAGANLEYKTACEDVSLGSTRGYISNYIAVTSLVLAIEEGSPRVVQALIDKGADVNARSSRKRWDLNRRFFQENRNVDWDDIDLDATLDPGSEYLNNRIEEHRWTPLMEAALEGDEVLIQMLLDAGADPRAQTQSGKTAADIAREFGQNRITQLLD